MEIRTVSSTKECYFSNVEQGEVFEYYEHHLGNQILLKTEKVVDDFAGEFNCVNLKTGEFFCVSEDDKVKVLKAVMEIER